ncbi:MAG: protein kinase [Bryobacteraceae bacterium]
MNDWSRIEELFQGALACPREQREEFLRNACQSDEEVRREVEELLAHSDSKDGFLEGSPLAALRVSRERLAPGAMVGRFRIIDLIGSGGMGEVYKASDTRLNRTVAVKVCHERFGERFEREARAIAALNHPNICTLYDVGPDYLVMEFLEGKPLRGPLPVAQALQYGAQAADALHMAHSKGVVHRDFKPANVLVTRTGVKLLDFGLAKLAAVNDNLSTENAIPGTLRYMAPEMVEGKPADTRSDIYAFGLVLYEALTGNAAFTASSPASLISAILREEPAPLSALQPAVPPALDRLVRKCLAKDPNARWQTAADLRDELLWIGQTHASSPAQPAPTRPIPGWVKVASLLALLLLAALVWRSMQRPAAKSYVATRLGGASTAKHPRISPDHQLVAFLTLVQNTLQVAVMKSDGSSWTVLTHQRDAGWANYLAWSRDGSRIYFSRHFGQPQGVFSVPTLGGEPSLILASAGGGLPLPDGSLIVARLDAEAHLRLHRFWIESGRIEPLPAFLVPVGNFPVAALPNGKEIVFQGFSETVGGSPRLHILNLESGKARPASPPFIGTGALAVTPDGKSLLVTKRTEDVVQMMQLPLQVGGEAQVLFSLPFDNIVRALDAGPDGSIYLAIERNMAVLLHTTEAGGDPRQSVLPELGIADFGVLPGGLFIRPTTVAGKARLLVSTTSGDTRPLVQTSEETSVPFAVSSSGSLACVIGSGTKKQIVIASSQDGRILRRVALPAPNVRSIALAPDDGTLYYASAGNIWAQSLSTASEPKRIIAGNQLSLDPSGKFLYVKQLSKQPSGLLRVPLDGSPAETIELLDRWRLTNDYPPANAVDRRGRLLFEIATPDSLFFSAALYDPARRTVTRIPVRFDGEIWGPTWTPDGEIAALGGPYSATLWHYHPEKH